MSTPQALAVAALAPEDTKDESMQRVDDLSSIEAGTAAPEQPPFRLSVRMWIVFLSLCITSLLSAFEATAVSTALPVMSKELGLGYNYVWVANCFFLTSAAFQPLLSQCADVFGRRWPMIISVAFFTLGSGISGGATGTAMLLAGRLLQGIGGGGINMLTDLIMCDLVPLSHRGTYFGIGFASFGVGTGLGPFIGGVLASKASWRWVFYLQLPIGAVSLILLVLFLQVNHVEASAAKRLKSIDYTGNLLLVAAVVSLLIALSWGGTRYAWSSGHVLAPLVTGICGLCLFVAYEVSPLCRHPTTPKILFSARTSCAAFAQTFLHAMLAYWWVYILPVYFQGVLLSSPERSGVQLLPTVITQVPAAVVAGLLMTRLGGFKLLHMVASAMVAISLGCSALLDQHSPTAAWALLQMVFASGSVTLLVTLLSACQVALPESANAAAAGAWAFFRSLGGICGFAVPAAIFNSRFEQLSYRITDTAVREALQGGQAFSHASRDFVLGLPAETQEQVVATFAGALRLVWLISVGFGGVLFLLAFMEQPIPLRTELDARYGLKEEAPGQAA